MANCKSVFIKTAVCCHTTTLSTVTPVQGMFVNASTTDATFTSVGIWYYENGAWVKL